MGVTIHFEGRLREPQHYETLVGAALDFAREHNWSWEEIEETNRQLRRVIDERDVDYSGLTKGIVLQPHPDSEPLRFEFDESLFMQEYCKTQFAGPATHIQVVGLLRRLMPLFEALNVYDECEYWETSDQTAMEWHFKTVEAALDGLVNEHPGARVAVRLRSGRILDADL